MSFDFNILPFSDGWATYEHAVRALFANASDPCVFYHPTILGSVRSLSPGKQPTHLVIGRRRGESDLSLAAPIAIRSPMRGFRTAALYECPDLANDHVAPLVAQGADRAQVEFLQAGWSELGTVALTVEHASHSFRDACALSTGQYVAERRGFRSPFVALPSTVDAMLDGLDKHFRRDLKRQMNRAREERIVFRSVDRPVDGYRLTDALDHLFLLHARRSAARARESRFSNDGSRRCHEAICRAAEASPGAVVFFEAVHHDRVVGSLYGFLSHARFCFYQHGFEPDYAKHSLGSLLILHAMEQLIERRVRIFDFMRGRDAYKRRWTEAEASDYRLRLARRSSRGRLSVALFGWRESVRRNGYRSGTVRFLLGQEA